MKHTLYGGNEVLLDGNPSGGIVSCPGLFVTWQQGPVPRNEDGTFNATASNGAFIEDLLEAVAARLRFYQDTKFRCSENDVALKHVESAIYALEARERRRVAEGTAGTNALDVR